MAKKIRNVKLHGEDIQKNSGKNISHTINKIKAHERYYTTILVLIFMVVISISIYLGLRVDSYNAYTGTTLDNGTGFSYTSSLIYLNQNNIGDTKENKDSSYSISISNMTNTNINYIIRIILDEDKMKECNCDTITYDKLRYTLEDKIERSFSNENMIITTGFIHPLEKEDIPIKVWISDEMTKEQEPVFFGKIVLEKIEE